MYTIYKITSIVNGKIYIGQTIREFRKRKAQHLCELRNNRHGNSYLQNAFNKYGEDNFVFEVIDYAETFDELDEKEEKYIKEFGNYNLDTGKYRGGKIRSNETKNKISLGNKGKIISSKQRKILSEINTGSKHPRSKLTDEDVYYIKFLYNPEGIKGALSRLAEKFNVDRSVICRIRNNLKWTHIIKETFDEDMIKQIKSRNQEL